jgi:hypothetical protein
MFQKAYWRIIQTSSCAAPWTDILKDCLIEKSELAQHAYEEGWDEARMFKIESSSRYRKYNESTHMECLTNPISQLTLDISPTWISIISNEVSN